MLKRDEIAPIPVRQKQARINELRQWSWLHSSYVDSQWTVSDTWDSERTQTINFDYMLADGRSLLHAQRLYATVKGYAVLIRDDRFSTIDDAHTHMQAVLTLMHLAHALTLRKLSSFAHLQPYDLAQIVEDCRYGTDAVLHASERVEAYLNSLSLGELPRYINRTSGRKTNSVSSGEVVAACNLPNCAAHNRCVATLIAKAAKVHGMTSRSAKYDCDDIRPVKNVTVQTMQRWLVPFENLYAMRRKIDADSIDFKPFALGASRVATVKGVGTDRTPTPPPKLALHLLEHAARRVINRDKTAIKTMDWISILRLATACWILIAGFSARRDGEIDDLRFGCISGDASSGYWLDVYIEKTLQTNESIPVPTLVAKAVEVLSSISAVARSKTGTDRLFQWIGPSGQLRKIDIGRHLDDFAAEVHTPMHTPRNETPMTWHWHPHQFRRFFAILYFYRFEGATIETLAHFLRHFNLEMTKRYVTQDQEAAALWTDVEWGYMGHVARSIVSGERAVAGGAGAHLKRAAKRLIDTFRRKLQIVSPDRVGASLTLLMQRKGMVLTPKPWVTCTCPQTIAAASTAACRRESHANSEAVGPNFAHAGPTVCSSCPHGMIEGSRIGIVEEEVVHLERASSYQSRVHTIFGELESARVVELRQVRDAQYGQSRPMAQPIK